MSTAHHPPTVLDLKLSFLRTQIAALSRPLPLPPAFNTSVPTANLDSASTLTLRQKHIDEALARLNEQVRKHSKLVYSGVAQRHVAEQIERLYWRAGERSIVDGRMIGEEGLERGRDYTRPEAIALLPSTWDESDGENVAGEYSQLVARVQGVDERRRELREKVARYRMLRESLRPFEDARETVQENLCTKNGEVERELQRMRMLLARVAGRMSGLQSGEDSGGNDDVDMIDEEEKIQMLLAMK